MSTQLYTRDFQMNLVAHLARDPELFAEIFAYVKLTDFDLRACQVVFETLQKYWRQFKTLPDFQTLQLHILHTLENVDRESISRLNPEENDSLISVMMRVATPGVLNSEYYRQQMPAYIKTMRASQLAATYINDLNQGYAADDFIKGVLEINDNVASSNDLVVDSFDENPEPIINMQTRHRVNAGLRILNRYTHGGLGLGENGMITACPGVGKTTGLINFLLSAVVTGDRGLFLTLELLSYRIKHRYHAMAAGIPAQFFKLPIGQWPEEMVARYEYVLSPKCPHFGRPTIMDMSKRKHTIEDVDTAIKLWMESVDKKGEDTTECRVVFVDWLDQLDHKGLGVMKNTREDVISTKLNAALGELARKHNVALWTATQGTRDADGLDILHKRHVAGAFHKNDALDINLGLGVLFEEGGNEDSLERNSRWLETGSTEDEDNAPECDRDLVMSIMKNRDNPPTAFKIYQGPTLRFWDKKLNTSDADAMLNDGKFTNHTQYLVGTGDTN